ncbi:MAG: chemotaxis protein CheA [Gammaproteobacteria bacterium]|nr:chemotaxis protein CheA [Gammaproteobacteria bacterium]
MSIDLERFHKSFFEESFEGLDSMETALLALDIAAVDSETINTIFRAAHSIKGGAATFGFAGVADYTHGVETLLDQMRAGKRVITQGDVDLLLRVVDVLRGLLGAARDGTPFDAAAVAATQAEIHRALHGEPAVAGVATAAEAAVAAPAAGWKIRFAPRPDLFRSGNDPLRIIRGLEQLGRLEVEADTTQLPSFADADAESCHLAWNLCLHGDVTRAEVEEQFSWVEDEALIEISALPAAVAAVAPEAAPAARPALALVRSNPSEALAAATPAPAAAPGPATTTRASGEGSSIRVGTEKIDALINLVGELVITQAMLTQQASTLDPVQFEKLLNGLSQLDRNTRMLQEAVMATRMLPMEAVFSRFPRVVRDLAAKLGKLVRLVTVGEQTELDKSVIEKITDPLNHLVRNSLDHGLELPEARAASGKDVTGTIRLSASHAGGHIVIEVADDGRGLDRARILTKAQANGLITAAQADAMPDAEVWQLIFSPGFSTAEKVTDVSGRGVGMDVVKKNIQALGGQVELFSEAGRGSRTLIRLPLTLAILDGMTVAVAGETFVLPLNAVVESLQPAPEQVKTVAGEGQVVRVRNEYLPMVALWRLFGLNSEVREAHKGILVLLESEGRKVALLVDELVGQQQVVIKNLEANYRRVPCISGATIMGDGHVALILDVGELVRSTSQAAAA